MNATATIQTSSTAASQRGQAAVTETVLILRLSGEAFGLPVSLVHEIIDPIPVTRVPNASAFAPGLINVRGGVVPLVDIRERLRMSHAEATPSSRIVVIDVVIDDVSARLAIIADAVEEVIDVDPARLERLPDLGAPWPEIYVNGVTRHRDLLVILLNADSLFRPLNRRKVQS